ncbi:MAG: hypothetical protein ACI4OY_10230 [Aristaeellaceae bacterium]
MGKPVAERERSRAAIADAAGGDARLIGEQGGNRLAKIRAEAAEILLVGAGQEGPGDLRPQQIHKGKARQPVVSGLTRLTTNTLSA